MFHCIGTYNSHCLNLWKIVLKANPAFVEEKPEKRDELQDPYWIHDDDLKDGAIDFLSKDEIQFWKEFIPQYLQPLEGNKEKEKQVSNDTIQLFSIHWFTWLMIYLIE